jgi:DNA (cytosine-5)-methyltransferase 1
MMAGWRGLFAIEKDSLAFETLRDNFLQGDCAFKFDWPSWLPQAPFRIGAFTKKYRSKISELAGKVDLVAGSPPCQGFSFAGSRDKHDFRNNLFHHYLELVELIRPPFVLLENVYGIDVEFDKKKRASENKRRTGRPPKPFSRKIRDALEGLGYRVYPGLIKAAEFGVPQRRPRYIMFGVDDALVTEGSEPDPFALLLEKKSQFLKSKGLPVDRPLTVREAISDLEMGDKELIKCPDAPSHMQIRYAGPLTPFQTLVHGQMNGFAPNSLRLARHCDEVRTRFKEIQQLCRPGIQLSVSERERFGLKKQRIVVLDPEQPSHTLTTLPDDILHYSEPRILTVRENARLQSFPDWFKFKGKYTTGGDRRGRECPRYTQVGNAVPPFIGELLGMVFRELRTMLVQCFPR